MKKIDAIWEKDNIGSNVLELNVERGDVLSDKMFEIPSSYDYIVVKVPTNMTEFNWFLGKNGFTMIETQLKLSKKISELDLNDRYIKRLLPFVKYEQVYELGKLNEIIERITPLMFLTDRITLDPIYGPGLGCARYRKYIRNSFLTKNLEIIGVYFKNKLVGFDMHQICGDVCYGKLGGVFSDVNIPGLGFLTVCAPLLYAYEKYGVKKFVPDISANNTPVLSLYNYFHFHIEEMTYVYVKHQ